MTIDLKIGEECPQVGVGGTHSEAYYDDGRCCWCDSKPDEDDDED